MEGREMRRSMTLSDHISATVVDGSSHLRDLLKVREEEDGGGGRTGFHSVNRRSVTLGSAIASEKRETFASVSGAGCSSSRTLMDIIQEEHAISRGEFPLNGTSSTASGGNWQAFKDRIRLRRLADSSGHSGGRDEVVIGLPSSPVFGRSMTVHRNESPVLRAGSAREDIVSDYTLTATAAAVGEEASSTVTASASASAEQEPVVRVSLMALLEQTDGQMSEEDDEEAEEDEEEEEEAAGAEEEERGMYHVCCVCMVRHKGAAFIPCGHTFCRLCSRELWVSRGNCPLCNGYILEILDIF